MPDRSRGLNGWPSILYFTFKSALSLLFWHRGHCFHPSGAGTEAGPWAIPATDKASAATKALMETTPFRICIPPLLAPELGYGSSGSTLMIAAPRLLPTQNVGGFVELSTLTRRTLVMRGRRYSFTSPVLVLSRTMRSLDMPPVQAYPALSRIASYGLVHGDGTGYSVNFSVLVSNIPILFPRNSANHRRS